MAGKEAQKVADQPSIPTGHPFDHRGKIHWNLDQRQLVERAVEREEGVLVDGGAFNAITAPHTGRAPKDRFVVREASSAGEIWWGPVNQAFDLDAYRILREAVGEHLESRELFARDMWAGADPKYRLAVRVISTSAWHNLFAYNMFRLPDPAELASIEPDFTILHAPEFEADPELHQTRSGAFVILNFGAREVLIGGTRYAGEIKKSIFSVLNFLLPRRGVLSMHCSANVGKAGDTALYFGLSGTGKTTLSADPERRLIGDDEHGWSDDGVFNFEGGCYAKAIKLSPEKEPAIYAATRRFGAILENCVMDEYQRVDFDDSSITENTRASYPLDYIPNHVPSGIAGHPEHIIFLTADAYGVLPPIARLTPEQAMYYFLSGYTAKVAGTERGVSEPQATFSACFGAPFLTLPPSVYADLFGRKIRDHDVPVWLVNTGWTGGPFGTGERMKLAYTRAMISAALGGRLDGVETIEDPVFGLRIPARVPDVPDEVLQPRNTWADRDAYDVKAREVATAFAENFRQFEPSVTAAVRNAGPRPG